MEFLNSLRAQYPAIRENIRDKYLETMTLQAEVNRLNQENTQLQCKLANLLEKSQKEVQKDQTFAPTRPLEEEEKSKVELDDQQEMDTGKCILEEWETGRSSKRGTIPGGGSSEWPEIIYLGGGKYSMQITERKTEHLANLKESEQDLVDLQTRIFVHPDNESQYNGPAAGCNSNPDSLIMCLEAALQLTRFKQSPVVDNKLVGEIFTEARKQEGHFGVSLKNILLNSSYRSKVVGLGSVNRNLSDLTDTIQTCADVASLAQGPGLAVVMTKPPESVMCFFQYSKCKGTFLVFDSHKRPIHAGAAILEFRNVSEMASYFKDTLFYMDPSIPYGLYNIFEATLLCNPKFVKDFPAFHNVFKLCDE